MAVYFTLLKPGDTVLGMNLSHGGHLTHGHPLNFSGQLYTIVPYGVRKDDERIDYDELDRLADEHRPEDDHRRRQRLPAGHRFRAHPRGGRPRRRRDDDRHGAHRGPGRGRRPSEPGAAFRLRHDDDAQDAARTARAAWCCAAQQYAKELDKVVFPGLQGGPLMHIIAAKAVCFKEAAEPAFAEYQRQIVANAKTLAAVLSASGFRLVSGGTDNHLMLVDVFSKGITGKLAEAALGKAGITVNKNAIPFDQNPPMVASGIRIGTPAVTTRGMREAEMESIGELIAARSPRPKTIGRWR